MLQSTTNYCIRDNLIFYTLSFCVLRAVRVRFPVAPKCLFQPWRLTGPEPVGGRSIQLHSYQASLSPRYGTWKRICFYRQPTHHPNAKPAHNGFLTHVPLPPHDDPNMYALGVIHQRNLRSNQVWSRRLAFAQSHSEFYFPLTSTNLEST